MSRNDETESRTEIERLVEELLARVTVQDMILTHLLVRVAGITDNPPEFVKLLMINIEDNLRQGLRTLPKSETEAMQRAENAIQEFEHYSSRLITMLTPKGAKNMQ